MFASVLVRGWVPVCTAYCSAGRPNASNPNACKHIAARHPEVARVDVGRDVAEGVPDVQALTRRVGEHVLHEHLVGGHRRAVGRRKRAHRVGNVEGALL